jgi:hypothetical protein
MRFPRLFVVMFFAFSLQPSTFSLRPSPMPTRKHPDNFGSTVRRALLLAACLCVIPSVYAADTANPPSADLYDYASPAFVTGTLYEIGSGRKEVLYTFRRTATRSNATVNVTRQFFATNGAIAAEENVIFDSGRLVNFRLREFQAAVSGAIRVEPDPKHPDRQKLFISYGHGLTPPAKGDTQNLPTDLVIDDTLYPYMMAHWDDLMRGDAVKFHFVSLEKERTFVFRFVKTGESLQAGRTVERIKMEPTNLIVAGFVNPLVFTVEKDSPHRILSYTGRTTPRVQKGKAWKYLDAETVFDW